MLLADWIETFTIKGIRSKNLNPGRVQYRVSGFPPGKLFKSNAETTS